MPQPVILAAKRTPIGRFIGGFSRVPSPQLGAFVIQAVLEEVPVAKDHVDECIMGCVLQAGLGQNPARQAGLKAGLPTTLNAMTVNKVCGSGLQAVMLAAQSIKAGDNQLVLADPAVRQIITQYTREAGLRNLEREIARACRRVAKRVAEGEKELGSPR